MPRGSVRARVQGHHSSDGAGRLREREGAAADLSGKPIEGAVLAGLMRQYSDTVNMVNAPYLAKERGLDIRSIRHEKEGAYNTLLRVTVGTEAGDRSVAGTLFGADAPRLTEIFGVRIEAELEGHMLYIVNEDAPGFIGRIGSLLGQSGINIGTFHLGRRQAGGGGCQVGFDCLGIGVQIENIDLGRRTITVIQKGGKHHVVKIHAALVPMLEQVIDGRTGGPLWVYGQKPLRLRVVFRVPEASGIWKVALRDRPRQARHNQAGPMY